jgi:hypothetical protein
MSLATHSSVFTGNHETAPAQRRQVTSGCHLKCISLATHTSEQACLGVQRRQLKGELKR